MHHGAVGHQFVTNTAWVLQKVLAAWAVDFGPPHDAVEWLVFALLDLGAWCATEAKVNAAFDLNFMAHTHAAQAFKRSSASGFAKVRQALQKWHRHFPMVLKQLRCNLVLLCHYRAELLQIHFDVFPVVRAATWPRLICKRFLLGAIWHALG